jgi:hypothetical protein
MDAKRKAFIDRHSCWIDFLNQQDKPEIYKQIIHNYDFTGDGVTITKQVIDLTVMTPAFKEFQVEKHLLDPDLVEGCDFKFVCEQEFIISCSNFMYENLKAISREERKTLETIGKFGIYEANTLLSQCYPFISSSGVVPISAPYIHPQVHRLSYIDTLAKYIYFFCEYITQVLDGGLKDKAKLGIYKVGVCPYQRRKEKECGKVYVGKKYDQAACDEHARKWRMVNCKRKKVGGFKKKVENSNGGGYNFIAV